MNLPVKELKIDRAFVSRMTDDLNLATIVQSTIELGHSLGLAVVAEGVEDPRGLALLRELGCDNRSGLFFESTLIADRVRGVADGSPAGAVTESGHEPAGAGRGALR